MTLIAGFRCSDGMLMCADSQETIGGHKVAVVKIEPFPLGQFDVAIAGSGNNGDLLDAFIQQVKDESGTGSFITLADVKKFLHEQLLSFLNIEAVLFPRSDRVLEFMISASCRTEPAFDIWSTKASRLEPIGKFKLVGWKEVLYRNAVARLFKGPIPLSQAIPLATYLFSLAADTSLYVSGRTSVLIMTKITPMFLEQDYVVQEFEAMTTIYRALLEDMLLISTDTAIGRSSFEKKFANFSATLFKLRDDYFQVAAKRQMLRMFRNELHGACYKSLPTGSVVTFKEDGSIKGEERSEEVEKFREMVKKTQQSMDSETKE